MPSQVSVTYVLLSLSYLVIMYSYIIYTILLCIEFNLRIANKYYCYVICYVMLCFMHFIFISIFYRFLINSFSSLLNPHCITLWSSFSVSCFISSSVLSIMRSDVLTALEILPVLYYCIMQIYSCLSMSI